MTLREHIESRLAGLRETRLSCSWGARLDARINELEWVLMRMDLEGAVSAARMYMDEGVLVVEVSAEETAGETVSVAGEELASVEYRECPPCAVCGSPARYRVEGHIQTLEMSCKCHPVSDVTKEQE